ncbi:MAG: C_GCAxxG_C_C family protein [Bacteroidales bacterium]|nr:C_GCAxxG_C_C family protein [Bacteroidales bacterium]
MTIEERAQKAVELNQKGYNCCQAVTAVLSDQTLLMEEQLFHISAGFAIGMGNMEGTCGALVGAVMIVGCATEGKGSLKLAKQVSETFQQKCGSVTCKVLKSKTPDGNILCPCNECIKNAVLSYGETVGLDNE